MSDLFNRYDSVYHTKKRTVWIVEKYDARAKRYHLMRVTADRTFRMTSAPHFVTVVPKPKIVELDPPKVKTKATRPQVNSLDELDRPSDLLNDFERAMNVLVYVFNHPNCTTHDIRRDYLKDYALRSVQRAVLALYEVGYLNRKTTDRNTWRYLVAPQHNNWVCLLAENKAKHALQIKDAV